MNTFLLLFLGLFCRAYCRDCLHPEALDKFNQEKFEGEWYTLGFSTANKSEEAYLLNSKCSRNIFKLENNKSYSVVLDYLFGDKAFHYAGPYTIQDPTKAKLQAQLAGYPLEYAYDILCTDYTNWAVTYLCSQIDVGHSSEFLSLLGRDRTKYAELISNGDAKQCVQDKLQISIDTLMKLQQDNC